MAPLQGDDEDDAEDDYIDVPNVVDTHYTTHRTFTLPKGKKSGSNYVPFPSESSSIKEQDDTKDKNKKDDIKVDSDAVADMAAASGEIRR